MSAYAALVSLLHTLGTILYDLPVIHNRAQLQSFYEEVIFLLDFLDNSSSYNSSQILALESKMREAAHKAEDLIEYGILDSKRRLSSNSNSAKMVFCFFFYIVIVLCSGRILASYTEVIPALTQSFLTEIFMCTMNVVVLYMHIKQLFLFQDLNDSQELRRVLYDFHIVVKEVVDIKDQQTSAHVALISLRKILDSIIDSAGLQNRADLISLHKKVSFLLDFLGNASTYITNQKSELQNLDATIIGAVYKAKNALIELQPAGKFNPDFDWRRFSMEMIIPLLISPAIFFLIIRPTDLLNHGGFPPETSSGFFGTLGQICIACTSYMISAAVVLVILAAQYHSKAPENQDLPQVIDDFSIIERDVIKIKDASGNLIDLPAAAAASSRQDLGGSGRNVVVGLDSDMEQIRGCLTQDSSKLEVISIVGMGGIGKTTLARHVYNSPDIVYHFDVRAWVTVTQEYSLCHVLMGLLDSAKILKKKMQEEINDERLGEHLHRYLKGRRYLIVMDDVWVTQIWDSVQIFFPDDCKGSRVVLISRLPNVASYPKSSSRLHQMRCLNDNDSWCLLREKVFGADSCPLELESIGREIARSCKGLPLAIVVIGGLLYKDNQIKIWREVEGKSKKSELKQIKEQCLEILGLSYNHLPHHLRPCFLYMGVFMADCEIPISRLINLWAAEGFLEPRSSKNVEELAEDYLNDLIERNLILVCKRSCNGKIRTCNIHDLLRDVCVQNARKGNFLHVVDSNECITREKPDETPRRLIIDTDALQVDLSHYKHVRSFLCIASKPIKDPSVVYLGFKYLRVLDVLEVHFGDFPYQILGLIRLRYLALHYDGSLPPSISKLEKLETIVHHHCSFGKYHPLFPSVFWRMRNLRHLYIKSGCYLFNPIGNRLPWKSFYPVHLQTLVGIRNFKWTQGIIKRIPNLKKLGIWYDVSSSVDWSTYQLETLVDLYQLESLKIIIKYDGVRSAVSHDPPKLAFPQKLNKLTLSGCGIPWASMALIGALPNLKALKLRCEAFSGHTWETVEGEFPQLIFLLLEEISLMCWETEAAHFPRLQRLVIRSCGMLVEIPSAVGDIPTLEMIELVDCHPSAVDSAKRIQEEQESMGNEVLKFNIDERRREAVEVNIGNLEARGVGAGHILRGLRVLIDVVRSARDDFKLPVIVLLAALCFIRVYWHHHSINDSISVNL